MDRREFVKVLAASSAVPLLGSVALAGLETEKASEGALQAQWNYQVVPGKCPFGADGFHATSVFYTNLMRAGLQNHRFKRGENVRCSSGFLASLAQRINDYPFQYQSSILVTEKMSGSLTISKASVLNDVLVIEACVCMPATQMVKVVDDLKSQKLHLDVRSVQETVGIVNDELQWLCFSSFFLRPADEPPTVWG